VHYHEIGVFSAGAAQTTHDNPPNMCSEPHNWSRNVFFIDLTDGTDEKKFLDFPEILEAKNDFSPIAPF